MKKYFDNIDHDRLKYILRECLERMRLAARRELKLEFNEKTQIFPISEGVDYLGWKFCLTQSGKVIRRLRTSNKKRFKRRLKYSRRRTAEAIRTMRRSGGALQATAGICPTGIRGNSGKRYSAVSS